MPSTSMVHRGAERGFSLIEMLMVVGIVGVVSAIAVPMVKNTLGNFSLSGDARALSNAVSLAKLRAASSFSQARAVINLTAMTLRGSWRRSGTARHLPKRANGDEFVMSGPVTKLRLNRRVTNARRRIFVASARLMLPACQPLRSGRTR